MSVRSVFPPADRMSRRSSSVVRAPCARARACMRAGVAQCAAGSNHPCAGVRACLCAGAGVAQCTASSKGKRPAKKRVGTLNKKKALRASCEAKRAEGNESGARALA